MKANSFKELLIIELLERQQRNSSYSLRAFARYLGMDHSRLSKIMRGERPVSWALARQLGPLLGLSDEQVEKLGATPTRERAGKAHFTASISLEALTLERAGMEVQRLLQDWARGQEAGMTEGLVLNLSLHPARPAGDKMEVQALKA